jgi:putative tricarboxylic transport membrane protein
MVRRALTGERLFAGVFLAAGILSFVEGLGYGVIRSDGIIGPGFIPVLVGVVLTVLGSGIILQTFTGAESRAFEPDVAIHIDSDAAPPDVEGNERSALLVFIGCAVALVASNWFGLILSLSALVWAILTFIEHQHWLKSLLIAALIGFGAWLIFVHFLEVPLGFGIFSPS